MKLNIDDYEDYLKFITIVNSRLTYSQTDNISNRKHILINYFDAYINNLTIFAR
jgi:hypothetical protein